MFEINVDGSVGNSRTPPEVGRAIDSGSIPEDYRGIMVPVLALFPVPQSQEVKWKEHPPKSEQERVDSNRSDEILLELFSRWQGNLKKSAPFLDEESQVLRELRSFFKSLDAH